MPGVESKTPAHIRSVHILLALEKDQIVCYRDESEKDDDDGAGMRQTVRDDPTLTPSALQPAACN